MRTHKIPAYILIAFFAAQLPLAAQNIPVDQYTIRADNTRVESANLEVMLIDAKNRGDKTSLYLTARELVMLGNKIDEGNNRARFSDLANRNLDGLLKIAQKGEKGADLFNLIYGGVLPLVYFEASLTDGADYKKIADIYEKEYSLCLNYSKQCDFDKAGPAFMFVSAKDKKNTGVKAVADLLISSSFNEEERLKLLEYSIPVMAAAANGQVAVESFIRRLAADSKPVKNVQGGYFDFFALVNITDEAYSFVKNACNHQESFVKGVCGQFGGDAPFVQYKKPVMTQEVKNLVKEKDKNGAVYYTKMLASKASSPYMLAASLRLYAALYDTQKDWREAAAYLMNLDIPADNLIVAARDIALGQLALNSNSAAFKNYFAARLNNIYFTVTKDPQMDEALKASLMNDAGIYYAKLTGYSGASPLPVVSDGGYKAEIRFKNNEAYIKGFWGSIFNFEERPAESFTNLLMAGLAIKGIAKNGDKIFNAVKLLAKESGNIMHNMPSVIVRAKAQFKAAAYFLSKGNTPRLNYAYVNNNQARIVMPAVHNSRPVGDANAAVKIIGAKQPAAPKTVGAPAAKAPAQNNAQGVVNKFKAAANPAAQPQPAANPKQVKAMDEDLKRLGYGMLRKVFRMSPRAAVTKLYSWGARPTYYQKLELSGEVYKIKDLNAFRVTPADKASGLPNYPKTTSKYLYRGMSLNSDEVKNIMVNGLRKVDMPKNNLAIMSAMATPGTNIQGISLSPYAAESAKYSIVTAINDVRGIPTLVHVKGINKKNAAYNAHGYFTGKDIPAAQLVRTSVLLNVDGKFRWGQVALKDGGFLFMPYK